VSVRTVERDRYEAVFKAVLRPAQTGLWVGVVVTIVLSFLFGFSYSFVGPELPREWPPELSFAAVMVPFAIAVILLPNAAQLLVIHGEKARAIETVNAFAYGEANDYTARTGRRVPTLLGIGAARRWLKQGHGYGTRLRTRLLVWIGELDAAAQVIAAMPTDSPADAFHRSLLRELLEFVATGRNDLAEPRALLASIPPGPERDHALASLAVEEARLEVDAGRDPMAPLAQARAQLTVLPKGASLRDRFVSSLPLSIGLFAVLTAIVWAIRS
jgi:hypothetical protein